MNRKKELRHLFVTADGEIRSNWKEAFSDIVASESLGKADVIWVSLPYEGDVRSLVEKYCSSAKGRPVVALSDVPGDEEGLLVFGAGAAGYCNGYSSPELLRQVAETVAGGGVWLGQSLLQRLVKGTARLAMSQNAAQTDWAASLTEREAAVARATASGASNKEIADQLNITERTVKAHLGSVFEKLKVRDRLQLTLLVNGLLKS